MTILVRIFHPLAPERLASMTLEDLETRIAVISADGQEVPEAEVKAYWVKRSTAPGHHIGRCEAREMLASEWPEEFPPFEATEGCNEFC